MDCRIRPFEKFIGRGAGRPMWTIQGRFEGATFVVDVHGQLAKLPTIETGADAKGPYAVVSSCTLALADGFHVDFGPEDEEMMTFRLHIYRDVDATQVASNLARSQGIDPDAVNVLISPDQQHSMYFHADGTPERTSEDLDLPESTKPN